MKFEIINDAWIRLKDVEYYGWHEKVRPWDDRNDHAKFAVGKLSSLKLSSIAGVVAYELGRDYRGILLKSNCGNMRILYDYSEHDQFDKDLSMLESLIYGYKC